jgi:sulfite exporter TauE/SafE
MVYAVLPLALVAGGAWQGAVVMFAFGLGTLPNMALVDVAATRIAADGQLVASRGWLKLAAGVVIIAFGLSGLAHAARVAGHESPVINALASICHADANQRPGRAALRKIIRVDRQCADRRAATPP